ncbi:ATP-dependent RNA helicase DDX5 [Elysia marginata]|uniref:ATP-dependent RNA helicase DDX5 n=1 Tax=Elysia marginata TaxID=1093978 RepID=A0AAV4F3E0_9GAST|nr:ATP-dependent RNA helicase DDX5 [Elysia marginata]
MSRYVSRGIMAVPKTAETVMVDGAVEDLIQVLKEAKQVISPKLLQLEESSREMRGGRGGRWRGSSGSGNRFSDGDGSRFSGGGNYVGGG